MGIVINSKFEKFSSDGSVGHTTVAFSVNEIGFFGNLVVDVDGVHVNTDNDVLVGLVKEKVYSVLFPSRAENERFLQIDKVLKKSDETLKRFNEVSDVTRKAFAEVTVQVTGLEDKLYRLAEHMSFDLDSDVSSSSSAVNEASSDGVGVDVAS